MITNNVRKKMMNKELQSIPRKKKKKMRKYDAVNIKNMLNTDEKNKLNLFSILIEKRKYLKKIKIYQKE